MPSPRLKAEYDRLYPPPSDRRNFGLHETVDLSPPWVMPGERKESVWSIRRWFARKQGLGAGR